MSTERAQNAVLKSIVIVTLLYLAYYFTASSFFSEERVTAVACPVMIAATVVTKFDGEDEPEWRRYVAVQCDYAAAGVPEPKAYPGIGRDTIYFENGRFHRFSEIANKRQNITEGDTFTCTARWISYKVMPLASPRTGDSKTVLTNCRIATSS